MLYQQSEQSANTVGKNEPIRDDSRSLLRNPHVRKRDGALSLALIHEMAHAASVTIRKTVAKNLGGVYAPDR